MPKETDHLERLYREGAEEQPPDVLDRAIAAAARSGLKPWYQRRGALAGISTAAALLVAAGLVSIQYVPERAATISAPPSPAMEFEHSSDLTSAAEAVSEDADAGVAEARRESAPAPASGRASAAATKTTESASRLTADRAPMEKSPSATGMNQITEKMADAEEDALTCDPSPFFDGRAYEFLPADEAPPRIQSEGRQWQCRNGVWEPVGGLESTAQPDTPPVSSPAPDAGSEQQ